MVRGPDSRANRPAIEMPIFCAGMATSIAVYMPVISVGSSGA
ncbi:hypothetical protein ACVWW1_008663 [Bradyrhizobium sp. JR3.5]